MTRLVPGCFGPPVLSVQSLCALKNVCRSCMQQYHFIWVKKIRTPPDYSPLENRLLSTLRMSTINHCTVSSILNDKKHLQSFQVFFLKRLHVLISKLCQETEVGRKSKTHYLSFQPFGVNQPGPYIMYTTVDANGNTKNGSGKHTFSDCFLHQFSKMGHGHLGCTEGARKPFIYLILSCLS